MQNQLPLLFPSKSFIDELADLHPYWTFDCQRYPKERVVFIRVRTLLEGTRFLYVQVRIQEYIFDRSDRNEIQYIDQQIKLAIVQQIAFEKSFYL